MQQANWGGGAAPLADNTDRLLNTTNDNSPLCSDTSCCSTSVLSQHQPVGRADLIALQQKVGAVVWCEAIGYLLPGSNVTTDTSTC